MNFTKHFVEGIINGLSFYPTAISLGYLFYRYSSLPASSRDMTKETLPRKRYGWTIVRTFDDEGNSVQITYPKQ